MEFITASNSRQTATRFLESKRDPMKSLTGHFNNVVKSIGCPVVVFIDDLDRCQGSYVVDLLEGIQRVFSTTQVTYVIAADRRWLSTSYVKAYESFAQTVDEPGRPLGYLFLEKAFQFGLSLPGLSSEVQAQYWKHLIQIDQSEGQETLQSERKKFQDRFQRLQTEAEVLEELQKINNTGGPIAKQAAREAGAKRVAAADVGARTEHELQSFAPLLEPNPRSMKRLVNAYGMQRAIATLAGVTVTMKQLALWTILVLRWPLLAEYLAAHPEMVGDHGELQENGLPAGLRQVLQDGAVGEVLSGQKIGASLDANAIRLCTYQSLAES